ncbi:MULTISPECIES: 4'-phosphopantetheinyl transferase superfamily protein [unclassified Streptomyces]|uniref:4'-phosphopantetheinyl transferase family protein n=1 Tax=unclassified Streptomyces TaxID=2593676 RepID=UPI00339E188E
MIEELLPPSVAVVAAYDDESPAGAPSAAAPGLDADGLYPEEALLVAHAVPKRRREFATVRRCARAALARLGAPPAPLLKDPRGAPGWPPGYVGSLTHCAGYRAAAVAPADRLAALGIDAEPHLPLPDEGVTELVIRPEERARIGALSARRPDVHWDRLLYSAKESVYKVWYPLTRSWLDFQDASLTVDPDRGTFTATLLVPVPAPGPGGAAPPPATLHGGWLVRDGLIVTAIALEH